MPDVELAFVDTNVLLYAFGVEEPKRGIAQDILDQGPVASIQVLSDAASVLHHKFGIPREVVIRDLMRTLAILGDVCPLDRETLNQAWDLWQQYSLPWYDSLILAAAIRSNCTVVYSEDFQDNQVFGGLVRVVNPFVMPAV